MRWWVSLVFVMIFTHAFAKEIYPFSEEKETAQFQHLLSDLRCLVCQNQDLADSNAGFAKDLRREIYEMVQQGQSDDEIVHYLTTRFGDYILFKPPMKGVTWLLWAAPLLFLTIGFVIFWKATRYAK